MVKSLMIDFGGVPADDDFRERLKEITGMNDPDPEKFSSVARNLMQKTG
jgi:hypothetical protein